MVCYTICRCLFYVNHCVITGGGACYTGADGPRSRTGLRAYCLTAGSSTSIGRMVRASAGTTEVTGGT
jgi:hypothetical protein